MRKPSSVSKELISAEILEHWWCNRVATRDSAPLARRTKESVRSKTLHSWIVCNPVIEKRRGVREAFPLRPRARQHGRPFRSTPRGAQA